MQNSDSFSSENKAGKIKKLTNFLFFGIIYLTAERLIIKMNNPEEIQAYKEKMEKNILFINEDKPPSTKKRRLSTDTTNVINVELNNNLPLKSDTPEKNKKTCDRINFVATTCNQHRSPKKRLNVVDSTSQSSTSGAIEKKSCSEKFQYGNYTRYYGYRNINNFHDSRLKIFSESNLELFNAKQCLDIGCNSGLITIEIAKKFNINHITGLDIDKTLINRVKKFIEKQRRFHPKEKSRSGYPFNINFIHGNYVLRDDILLEIEHQQFDVLLCLSVTKWIHLNFGDSGLKQAFKRMFLQLKPNGILILEAQPWNNYSRRKNLTETIKANYRNINFFPNEFTKFLLSDQVGFESVIDLGAPNHSIKGFQRPVQIFQKK